MLRVAGKVAVEVGGEAAQKQVVIVAGHRGVVQVAEGNAVSSIRSFEGARLSGPFIVAGVFTFEESAVCEEGKITGGLANDPNFIPILKISTNTCTNRVRIILSVGECFK